MTILKQRVLRNPALQSTYSESEGRRTLEFKVSLGPSSRGLSNNQMKPKHRQGGIPGSRSVSYRESFQKEPELRKGRLLFTLISGPRYLAEDPGRESQFGST